jgi:hypothetical protein
MLTKVDRLLDDPVFIQPFQAHHCIRSTRD